MLIFSGQLSRKLIGISLFDATNPLDVERCILQMVCDEEGLKNPPKGAFVDLKETRAVLLDEFTSIYSFIPLNHLGLLTSFLEADTISWENLSR